MVLKFRICSTVECVRDFRILRLGARIWHLRKEDYEIEERRVEGTAYSEYRLRPALRMDTASLLLFHSLVRVP
jgi:hypothetical protein